MWAIAKADLLERLRQPRLWQVLFIFVIVATLLVPGEDASYATIAGETQVVIPTAAIVGTTVAIMTAMMLICVGPFIAAGSIQRDRDLRVHEIVWSTRLGRASYLGGKFMANALILSMIAIVVQLTALIAFPFRGSGPLILADFLQPLLALSIVMAIVVAAIAVVWDAWQLQQVRGGALLYIFIMLTLLSPAIFLGWQEPTGLGTFIQQVEASDADLTGMSFGLVSRTPQMQPVGIPGMSFTLSVWAAQGAWLLAAVLLVALVGRVWREEPGYKRGKIKVNTKKAAATWARSGRPDEATTPSDPFTYHQMPPATLAATLLRRTLAELSISVPRKRMMQIILVALWVLAFLLPLDFVRMILTPVALLMTILLVAPLPVREQANRLEDLIFTLPGAMKGYVLWKTCTALILAGMASGGILIRLLVQAPSAAFALLGGLVLTIGWLMLVGYWSASLQTGTVSMGFLWYLAAFNDVPAWMDYAGIHNITTTTTLLHLGLGLLLLIPAQLIHQRRYR